MPAEKPNYGPTWMNYAMWRILVALEGHPMRLSDLPRPKRSQVKGTVERMVTLGYLLGDMALDDPWLMLSREGIAAMARVRALPRLPLYAGGDTPYYKPKAPPAALTYEPMPAQADAPRQMPSPVFDPAAAPAPTAVIDSDCTVSITATLEVSVDMVLSEFRDAQSVAQVVAHKLMSDSAAMGAALRGWRINGVIQGDKMITAEG